MNNINTVLTQRRFKPRAGGSRGQSQISEAAKVYDNICKRVLQVSKPLHEELERGALDYTGSN